MLEYTEVLNNLIISLNKGLEIDTQRIQLLKSEIELGLKTPESIITSLNEMGDLIDQAKLDFFKYMDFINSNQRPEKIVAVTLPTDIVKKEVNDVKENKDTVVPEKTEEPVNHDHCHKNKPSTKLEIKKSLTEKKDDEDDWDDLDV